ncbi:MAG: NTPase [Gemmatimonadota bacterium]|nr:MAG: NTPase [Gemmatimonadota bacterium]
MKNILLTGVPGIGKTTVIEKILSEISLNIGGFYTRELRRGKVRIGFRIVTPDGHEGILAHTDCESPWRVGKYGVNVREMERVGVAALDQALQERDLIVMDEIGKMELFSKRFQHAVLRCLRSEKRVLGTIQKSKTPFLEAIRARKDVRLVEVTISNRDALPQEIAGILLKECDG